MRKKPDWSPLTTLGSPGLTDHMAREAEIARPERFELPTAWFVARYSPNVNIFLAISRIELCNIRIVSIRFLLAASAEFATDTQQ